MSGTPLRIAVLYSRLSGYVTACLRQLKVEYGAELLVFRIPPADDAPFDVRHFAHIDRLVDRPGLSDADLSRHLADFAPDGVLMAGWFDRGYLKATKTLKAQGVPVIAGSDAQWEGSPKQRLGALGASRLLHPSISALWVAGERQRQLAERLGFRGARLLTGYYSCDWERFAAAHDTRTASDAPHWLFVGRYAPVKGLDVLAEAYRRYRITAADPWPLVCVGTGPEGAHIRDQDGILDRGFVQPDRLPDLMREASGFILPSRREPWGVVLHEAAAAGLPLVSSSASGAAVHLLRDGFNGFTFENGNAAHLAECLHRVGALSTERRTRMGSHSHLLSRQYTPSLWASTLVEGFASLRASA